MYVCENNDKWSLRKRLWQTETNYVRSCGRPLGMDQIHCGYNPAGC
jgi:hypothetical protein